MMRWQCRLCGNRTEFRVTLIGSVKARVTERRGRQVVSEVDMGSASVDDVVCLGCGGSLKKRDVEEIP
jgi:Ni,Fe-hydrogenase III large subunit